MRSPIARGKAERGAQRLDDRNTGLPSMLFHTVASRIASQKISDSTALPSLSRAHALQHPDSGKLFFTLGYSALNNTDVMAGTVAPLTTVSAPDAFYRLESDGTDSGGNALNLTNTGSVTFASGRQGNGAFWDGTTLQYLSRADSPYFSGGARSWSGSAWVNVSEVPPSFARCLVSKGVTAGNQEYRVLLTTSGYFQMVAWDSGGTTYTVNNTLAPAVSGLLNQWLFVTWGYNHSTNEIFIGLNGTINRQVMGGNPVRDSMESFRVGVVDAASGTASVRQLWKGGIDALGLYPAELTSLTLIDLYNSGMGSEFYSGAWHG